MRALFSKIRGRSPTELAFRGRQAASRGLEIVELMLGRSPTYEDRAFGELNIQQTFQSIRGPISSPRAIATAIGSADVQFLEAARRLVVDLRRGSVSLLGHGPLFVGNPPQWHREPVRDVEVPRRHWSKIDHLNVSQVGDHKVLWELNRLQYLLVPAFLWLLNQEQECLELVQTHLASWLCENPPRIGVNWRSSLEVGLRAITLCWLIWMLPVSAWQPDLRRRLERALELHAIHIESYLSTYSSPNTHLTGEGLALFYLGTLFQGSPGARRWRIKGALILEGCADRHVLADGIYFEQASQYHRYTAEIYLHYLLLADSTAWMVSPKVRMALTGLLEALRTITDGAGFMPLIGDDDGGLLFPVDHRRPDDVKGLLLAGAVTLDRRDLIEGLEPSPAMAYWLCGTESTTRLLAKGRVAPVWRNIHFDRGGIAVLRDGWDDQAAVAVIDAGPHGAISCGHSHADALAMTLAIGTSALFVDRGTSTYSGQKRDVFRSTISHNTFEIDGEPSALTAGPFRWISVPPAAQGVVYSNDRWSGFRGSARGHVGTGNPSIHRRVVLHERAGSWLVWDVAERSGATGGVVRWQLASGLKARVAGSVAVMISSGRGRLLATLFAPLSRRITVQDRDISMRHGNVLSAPVIELHVGRSLESVTLLIPGTDQDRLCIESIPSFWSWRDARGVHRIACASHSSEESITHAGLVLNAQLSWWIEPAGGGQRGRECFGPDLAVAAIGLRDLKAADGMSAAVEFNGACDDMVALERRSGRWGKMTVVTPSRCGAPI